VEFADQSSTYKSSSLILAEIDYHFLLEFEKWLRKKREINVPASGFGFWLRLRSASAGAG